MLFGRTTKASRTTTLGAAAVLASLAMLGLLVSTTWRELSPGVHREPSALLAGRREGVQAMNVPVDERDVDSEFLHRELMLIGWEAYMCVR